MASVMQRTYATGKPLNGNGRAAVAKVLIFAPTQPVTELWRRIPVCYRQSAFTSREIGLPYSVAGIGTG
jgi:hypothetical protein